MITAGIDVGSISTKAVLLRDGELLAARVIPSGYNSRQAGAAVYAALLAEAGLRPDGVARVIATGYGRKSVEAAAKVVTEISCQAAGAHFLDPQVRGVIDIGGQDSKAIALDARGKVQDFVMNDKCAAGTGRFLEVMARALEVDLDGFGALSLRAESPARVSSLCTVFAESEIISLIAAGETRENIVAGIHEAIAARVVAMASRLRLQVPIMMTGGVARNVGVVQALERALGQPLVVSGQAQVSAALGAALIAQAELES